MKQRKMKKFIYDLRLLINNNFYFSKSFKVISRCLQSQTKQKQQKIQMKQSRLKQLFIYFFKRYLEPHFLLDLIVRIQL
jgi:arginine exporter protein ArgO